MTTNSRRIGSVEALPEYRLMISWKDGGQATVNMTGVIQKLAYFHSLKDESAFAQVEVIGYGTGIEWANGIDYSSDSLEVMAAAQAEMTHYELATWKKDMILSVAEMASIFSVSASTIKNYLTGQQTIPVAMQIACLAMRRDQTILHARFRPRVAGRPRKTMQNAQAGS